MFGKLYEIQPRLHDNAKKPQVFLHKNNQFIVGVVVYLHDILIES